MTVWNYPRCTVVNVHDGDTLSVDIDFGQDIWVRRRAVRLAGIAARELSEPGGREARDFLAQMLPLGTLVEIESTGWDKWAGRIDGAVFITPMRCVNNDMVTAGYAVPWDGKGVQPKPVWPIPAASRE